ncbi:MAG: L-aspartate oxidase [Pseudomonadota bacterium]
MTAPASTPIDAPAPGADQDVLILGAGLAGLFLALKLAPRPCLLVSPAPLGQAASSAWAQGGLAAALHPADSPESHAADTVAAGAGLVDPVVARLIAEDGPARVRDLLELGVPFDRTPDGALALSLEAAHSHPRVARVAGDLAGRAIMSALVDAARASDHIKILENAKAEALLLDANGRCGGAALRLGNGEHIGVAARETILCVGGSGGLYRVTTNPPEARGDALAMAHAAGALIADSEFIQFHPTALDVGRDPAPLATEALRGEGATLVGPDGAPFMMRYHPKGDLAPRDEVARAIHAELVAGRGAYLDAREAVGDAFPTHFPTVFGSCQAADIDPRKDLMPIAPAAHYHMGGVVSDLWGQSTIDGLSVCGECASTGAHGANRLASNSLLEAVVFAARIAERLHGNTIKNDPEGPARGLIPPVLPAERLSRLRIAMADHCGVVRDAKGLDRLLDHIENAERECGPARALAAARLIASAASARRESLGGHYRSDFPQSPQTPKRTFLVNDRRFALSLEPQ